VLQTCRNGCWLNLGVHDPQVLVLATWAAAKMQCKIIRHQ
jgi:hypothetical protein